MMKKILFLMMYLTMFSCEASAGGAGSYEKPEVGIDNDYELSYWIDMDVVGDHLRGYWQNTDYAMSPETPEIFVANAAKQLKHVYGANKLYVIYHRQYEIETAKKVFSYWANYGELHGMEIVPCVVLQSYKSGDERLNFTDDEIVSLAKWSLENINDKDFAIYDVYTRDQEGSLQDIQLKMMYSELGNVIVKVGMQPMVALNKYYKYAVQDCWTAECQGRTNELWENPVYYKGSYDYGRRLLEIWVKDRIDNDSRKWVYCLIPVAWDYEVELDKPSYDCPGDNALTNDPPVPGRIKLCHQYISGCYNKGLANALMGGYSCDLHILQANSAGCGKDSPNFYKALREDTDYAGYFAGAINEIGEVYKQLSK